MLYTNQWYRTTTTVIKIVRCAEKYQTTWKTVKPSDPLLCCMVWWWKYLFYVTFSLFHHIRRNGCCMHSGSWCDCVVLPVLSHEEASLPSWSSQTTEDLRESVHLPPKQGKLPFEEEKRRWHLYNNCYIRTLQLSQKSGKLKYVNV